MSLTLFQQYEQRRKSYAPGAIWVTKFECVVQKLEILPKDTPNVRVYIGVDELVATNKVSFLIIESEYQYVCTEYMFNVGCKLSWSKRYMERYYKPIFESTL